MLVCNQEFCDLFKEQPAQQSNLLLFPGEGFRFLRDDEVPLATDEYCIHDGRLGIAWKPWGINSEILAGVPKRSEGWFFRRKKAA